MISCIQARIESRIADGEVVYDLPLPVRQVEVAMHFVIVKGANACRR